MRKQSRKRSLLALVVMGAALSYGVAHAQDIPAATRGDLEVGGALSAANPDLTGLLVGHNGQYTTNQYLYGGSIFANFNVTEHFSLTAQFDYPDYHTPQDFLEKSYLVGVRYMHPVGRYIPYAKVLAGLGSTSYDRPVTWIVVPGTPGSYTTVAFGGGLDVRLAHKLVVRAIDYQYEDWLSFPGGSIHPSILSVGIAYRIR
jgi:hypothetical protein